jgi:aryl-alcohol dehydrogenase-like predicted oxidoreductase
MRNLGNTDIKISALGLGTWQFSNGGNFVGGYWDALPADRMRDIVAAALANGINWFDTAQMYGNGTSEQNLARALRTAGKNPGDALSGDIRIATKWWPVLKTANNLRNTIDERLTCLEGFPIDLHQVHQPLSVSSVEKQMHAMADLLEAGKIRSIGISNFTANAMCKADDVLRSRGHSLAANQVRYNLMARQIEKSGILQEAKNRGISIIAWSPLEQGMLSGRFHREPERMKQLPWMRRQALLLQKSRISKSLPLIDALERIAGVHGASVTQIALSWLIYSHGDTVVAIPGASSVSQVEQNAGALRLQLSDAERNEIDEKSRCLS